MAPQMLLCQKKKKHGFDLREFQKAQLLWRESEREREVLLTIKK